MGIVLAEVHCILFHAKDAQITKVPVKKYIGPLGLDHVILLKKHHARMIARANHKTNTKSYPF